MGTKEDIEYAAFSEKVKRTVYIDNLSPLVTEAVLKGALGQFGNVTNVQFIPNFIESRSIPQCVLVEMETAKQAKSAIVEITTYPFMMSGMPRPVRACAAEEEMFGDRPVKPGRKIQYRWVDPKDADFGVAEKLKNAITEQSAEASYMLQLQLEEEENLAKQQAESLKANHKKFEMLENLVSDGAYRRLRRHYNLNPTDD